MSADPANGWGRTERTIHGHRDEIDAIQQAVLSSMTALGWTDDARFALRLVLEESLVNAHVHGNRRDLARSIQVAWAVSPGEVRLTIEDEGEGYDPAAVPDPTEEHNLDVPSGRGLVLMKAYMDEVSHNERGNIVHMVRRRGAPGTECDSSMGACE